MRSSLWISLPTNLFKCFLTRKRHRFLFIQLNHKTCANISFKDGNNTAKSSLKLIKSLEKKVTQNKILRKNTQNNKRNNQEKKTI